MFTNQKNKKNSFNRDMMFEKNSARYLEDYTTFHVDFAIDYEVKAKHLQLSGIDYVATVNGQVQNIDAKAIASDLPTFSFEVLGNRATNQVGWLLQENSTTHLLLIYHKFYKLADEGYKINKTKDINDVNVKETELILIEKSKLLECIREYFDATDYDSLEEVVEDLIWETKDESENTRFIIKDKSVERLESGTHSKDTMTIVSTGVIKEKPMNIVIQKEFLKSIADKVITY